MIRSKKITKSARGQSCTMNIVEICNYQNETTVYAHFPSELHGIGMKSSDISGGFCCSNCHDAIDGRTNSVEFKHHRHWYLRRSMERTLEKLFELNILKIA